MFGSTECERVCLVEILTDFSIRIDLNCEFVLLKILLTLFEKIKYAVLVTGWQAAHGVQMKCLMLVQ